MTNTKQKREFLETLPAEKQVALEHIFRTVGPIEDELNKDCSVFSVKEIGRFFDSEYKKDRRSLTKECRLLDAYTKWMQVNYPVQYADYPGYMERLNLNLPIYSVQYINPDKIYTPTEFMDIIDEMESIYDKMLFLAIYEGLWTTTNTVAFFTLGKANLNLQENSVTFPDGIKKTVSATLMQLLLKGANQTTREGLGIQKSSFDAIMEKNPALCYKRLDINIFLEVNEIKLKIRNHIQNQRRAVLRGMLNPEKFTVSNIQMSGVLNALIMAGITENFNDYRTYEENPVAGKIAERYDFIYKGAQKNNLHRRFEPYFLSFSSLKDL